MLITDLNFLFREFNLISTAILFMVTIIVYAWNYAAATYSKREGSKLSSNTIRGIKVIPPRQTT